MSAKQKSGRSLALPPLFLFRALLNPAACRAGLCEVPFVPSRRFRLSGDKLLNTPLKQLCNHYGWSA